MRPRRAFAVGPPDRGRVAGGENWLFHADLMAHRKWRTGTVTDSVISAGLAYKVRARRGLVLKAAVMNEQPRGHDPLKLPRVAAWTPEAGVLLTE